jgi:hypothetical protein
VPTGFHVNLLVDGAMGAATRAAANIEGQGTNGITVHQ